MPPLSSVLTVGSLAASFVVSWIWFAGSSGSSRFEPALAGLGVAGAVAGILASQQNERRRARTQTVRMLVDELDTDAEILADPRFARDSDGAGPTVFPRLRHSAVDLALSSGGAQALGDEELLQQLHAWRDAVAEFNRRLEITELRTFIVADVREMRALTAALHRESGRLEGVTRRLAGLRLYLAETYPESVDRATLSRRR